MTNPGNNNTVYCTNDKKNYFISRDKGKSWQPVKDNNFFISIINGEILYGYVGPGSYTSDGKLIHSSRSTKYPFAPFIKCNNNLQNNLYDFQADLEVLRVLMFNNGARFSWDRKVRLAYDKALKDMAEYYTNQLNHNPSAAGWGAKDGRNGFLKKLRRWTHPTGLKKARMRKSDKGLSDLDALKNAVANFEAKPYLPKNFDDLSQTEKDSIRRPIVKKFKDGLDKNPSKIYEALKKR